MQEKSVIATLFVPQLHMSNRNENSPVLVMARETSFKEKDGRRTVVGERRAKWPLKPQTHKRRGKGSGINIRKASPQDDEAGERQTSPIHASGIVVVFVGMDGNGTQLAVR